MHISFNVAKITSNRGCKYKIIKVITRIKKIDQTDSLGLQNILSEIKNLLDEFLTQLTASDKISEVKPSQQEIYKEKHKKKK